MEKSIRNIIEKYNLNTLNYTTFNQQKLIETLKGFTEINTEINTEDLTFVEFFCYQLYNTIKNKKGLKTFFKKYDLFSDIINSYLKYERLDKLKLKAMYKSYNTKMPQI